MVAPCRNGHALLRGQGPTCCVPPGHPPLSDGAAATAGGYFGSITLPSSGSPACAGYSIPLQVLQQRCTMYVEGCAFRGLRAGGCGMGCAESRSLRRPSPGKEEGPGPGQWAVALTQTVSSWSLPLPAGAGGSEDGGSSVLSAWLEAGAPGGLERAASPRTHSHGQGGVAPGTLAPGR